MTNSNNRYIFNTTIEGFVNVAEPSGKFNNCCFAYKLPDEVIKKAEKDRDELLKWVKTKVDNPTRIALNPAKWDEEGLCKFSFDGDTGRARPVFVDSNGDPVDMSVLRALRSGTRARLIVQQFPYTKPAMGTSMKVLGVQIIELATNNGSVDSGALSEEEVAGMFGKVEGFKADDPAVRKSETIANEYSF